MDKKSSTPENQLPQIKQKETSSLTQLQQQFNSRITEIDTLKAQIAERNTIVEEARARVQKEIHPLVQKLVQQRVRYVHMLDEAFDQDFLPKQEKMKLAHLIKDLAHALLKNNGIEELKTLHDKYVRISYKEETQQNSAQAREEAQQTLKKMLGIELGHDDMDSLEALQARLDKQMLEEQQKREQQQASRQKSKAQLAKEEKMKVELQSISKATRKLYTTLVKLLHPDKEQDPTARIWKEEAMKKVTIAYNQDDFYELLRLQMEFMHEQEQHLDQVPEEQLTYYIQLLKEQIRELQEEQSNFFFSPEGRLYNNFGGSPKQMEAKFRKAKNAIREEIQQLQYSITEFQDPKQLREYLKGLELQ
ncbi:hypothetical protein [Rufibacter roseus]|uniref:J domain-containing protein n=1 Tax=Rufibacter roseus TaxID=1567108 RepID=A0ABW2DR60_9BACT|nr:hypothetical protein [Rufibacter roseus]